MQYLSIFLSKKIKIYNSETKIIFKQLIQKFFELHSLKDTFNSYVIKFEKMETFMFIGIQKKNAWKCLKKYR